MKRWATIAAPGTWNANKTAGEYDPDLVTHVQRLYEDMPEPKYQKPGLGKKHGWVGKVFGGAFGVGAKARVHDYVEWLQSHDFERLLLVGHSRGCGVVGALLREMEKHVRSAWLRGEESPRWCRADCVVMLDPVLSFGLDAPAKWMLRFVPRRVRWHLNIDRVRTLPAFVKALVVTYSLDDVRPAFAPTFFQLSRENGYEWRRWMRGVHSVHGGYRVGEVDERRSVNIGSWVRQAIVDRYPELDAIDWRWPKPVLSRWRDIPAVPAARRPMPKDLAKVHVTDHDF